MKSKYICEQVFVETPVDTDRDGKLDLISVYIKRPVCDEAVPAVFVANPYLMHCNEDWYDLYSVNAELKAFENQDISEEDVVFDLSSAKTATQAEARVAYSVVGSNEIEEYKDFECISPLYDSLVDRGYAAVYSGGLGTRGSEGYVLSGSHEEILAFEAVINWLNGRARAFTALDSSTLVEAGWCTGSVAMSGKSYLGTLCIGVSMTGVEGLKTIIPEAGIASWYDYYRTNGLVCSPLEWQGDDIDILSMYCASRAHDDEDWKGIESDYRQKLAEMHEAADRESGNYNRFWDERNYLRQIDNMRASALVISGLNDFNVKPTHAIKLFKELERVGAERKLLLHRGEHVYIYNLEGSPTMDIINRWLDHYLKGVNNGIEKESMVVIEDDIDQLVWRERGAWDTGDELVLSPSDEGEAGFVDEIDRIFDKDERNYKEWERELILEENENSLRYEFLMDEDLTISGDIEVSFEARIDQPTAVLSAMLVDLGDRKRLTGKMVGEQYESFTFEVEDEPSEYRIITRGHLNAQNRSCLYSKESIRPGELYEYSFSMIPMDYTVKAGNSLGLIVYGVDPEQTLVSSTRTEIVIKQESLRCVIGTLRDI